MKDRNQNLIDECKRQEESCLYTSTILYAWLKSIRLQQRIFIIFNILLGAMSTTPLFMNVSDMAWISNLCGFLAGIFPSLYKVLGFDQSLIAIHQSAGRFKRLQDRFRQAYLVTALDDFEQFYLEFKILMEHMDNERERAPSAPERFFRKARRKINDVK